MFIFVSMKKSIIHFNKPAYIRKYDGILYINILKEDYYVRPNCFVDVDIKYNADKTSIEVSARETETFSFWGSYFVEGKSKDFKIYFDMIHPEQAKTLKKRKFFNWKKFRFDEGLCIEDHVDYLKKEEYWKHVTFTTPCFIITE